MKRLALFSVVGVAAAAPALAQPSASTPPVAPAPTPPATSRPAPRDLKGRVDVLEGQIAELAQAAAASATASAAVQELGAKIGALEQAVDALGRGQQSHADLVARGDELERRVGEAEDAANALATRLGDVQAPGGGVTHERGFRIASADDRFSMTIGGYVQPRLEVALGDRADEVEAAGFLLRRARLAAQGNLGGDDVAYRVMLELRNPATQLLDAFVDYDFLPTLGVRVGQAKVPYTRQWTTEDPTLKFVERPAGLDDLRYDRDVGAWLRGGLFDGRATWTAGLSNGGGKNAPNDNIDFALAARFDAALLGERFEGYGDVERSHDPRIMIGGGVVHDLVALPSEVGGVAVGELDVDDDGVGDNVRVVSGSLDVAARLRGVELAVEVYARREYWGTVLEHSANADLADAIAPSSSGERNYVGTAAEATWVVLPTWLVGARVAHTRLSLLGVGGQEIAEPPPGDRLLELDVTSHLLEDGYRSLGFGYTFQNYANKKGPDPVADKSHRFVVEYQWRL